MPAGWLRAGSRLSLSSGRRHDTVFLKTGEFCMLHRKCFPFGFAAAGCIGALGSLALAQAPAAAPLMVHQLKPNVYWVEGGGGNSGVIIGDKGVIVVDAKPLP